MSYYTTIITALTSVTSSVSHGAHLKSDRYIVWMEDSGQDLTADGKHAEHAVTGTIDLYTKTEFDAYKGQIETALDTNNISWYWNSTQYEEDTGFWHYEWVWTV